MKRPTAKAMSAKVLDMAAERLWRLNHFPSRTEHFKCSMQDVCQGRVVECQPEGAGFPAMLSWRWRTCRGTNSPRLCIARGCVELLANVDRDRTRID